MSDLAKRTLARYEENRKREINTARSVQMKALLADPVLAAKYRDNLKALKADPVFMQRHRLGRARQHVKTLERKIAALQARLVVAQDAVKAGA